MSGRSTSTPAASRPTSRATRATTPIRCSPDLSHEDAARQFDAIALTTPERAARIIHRGVAAGRSRILVGPDAYLFDALARLAPSRYFDVLARLEPLVARRS